MSVSLKYWIVVIITLGAFVVLIGLGTWQVKRLQWKEALIAETRDRIIQPPMDLPAAETKWKEAGDVDYLPVRLEGEFQHDKEMYYYNTHKGTVGWNVFTPLLLKDGRRVLVNRGFVPDQFRQSTSRGEYLFTGRQIIAGLARNPLFEKPNTFVPENDLESRSFFWKSYAQMTDLADSQGDGQFVPFFVDAGKSDVEGALPVGGTTRISFPNNHLQYAITWYGLAGALVLVCGFFWRSNRANRSQSGS